MTILEWLVPSMKKLNEVGADSPRRDCLVLIEDLLGKDRSWVNAHADFNLTPAQTKKLDSQISRRIKREPLAYIRGKAWFYGRFFEVNPDVLVPRPETESFISLIKEIKPKNVIDIGTGSGCLAITAKLELPSTKVLAVDIDNGALNIAKKNAKKHIVKIEFINGSLLEPFADSGIPRNTVLLANLPYVAENRKVSKEIEYEPKLSWLSGKDGLDHYREFWEQVKNLPQKPKYILTESLENQHEEIKNLAQKSGYKLQKTEILVQQFRTSD